MPFSFDDWLQEAETAEQQSSSVRGVGDAPEPFVPGQVRLRYQSTWEKLFAQKHGEGSGPYNGRNNALTSLVGLMRHKNLPYEAALIMAQGWNKKQCVPPLDQSELQPTLQRLWADLVPTPDALDEPDQEWQWMTMEQLLNAPPVEWVVKDCLLKNGFNLIGALPGGAKSWLMLDLARCLATGTPWMGRFPLAPQDVLYVDEEMGPSAFRDRAVRMGFTAETTRFTYLGFQGVQLDDPEHMQRIVKWCEDHGGGVVFLDTLIRVSAFEENSNSEMRNLFSLVKRLIKKTGTTVIAAHHLTKSQDTRKDVDPREKFRGAGDIVSAASMAYLIEPDPSNQCLKFYAAKSRNCATEKSLLMRFRVQDMTDNTVQLVEVNPDNPIMKLHKPR